MKKFLYSIGFLWLGMAQVSASSCIDLPNNLKRGDENKKVLKLQNFLKEKGFLKVFPNGYFGKGTFSAVKMYQESVGLSQSGQVFPLTRNTIKQETCISSVLVVATSTPQYISPLNKDIHSTSSTLVSTEEKPIITNINKTIFFAYVATASPMIIYGSGFSSTTNLLLLRSQESHTIYSLGDFSSEDGITINASSSFMRDKLFCGDSCYEILPPDRYDVIIKNKKGESNNGHIVFERVDVQTSPNSPQVSFIPKTNHAKLVTFTLGSSVPVSLNSLKLQGVSFSTSSVILSNYTITDVLLDKIINSGPPFTFVNQTVSGYRSKIYELYANISDIEKGKIEQVHFTGDFIFKDTVSGDDISVPITPFSVSVSY